MTESLGPQFLYHGTAMEVEGPRLLPASEHGKGSYWGDTGSTRGEPAEKHAWAHPNESKAWEFADDRLMYHVIEGGESVSRRSRVYAVHQNEKQSGGNDSSIPGEVKAPHFDIAHRIDTKPGHQGTFPEINWNEHVQEGKYLPGDEDANHPSHLSVQFGHRLGVHGERSLSLAQEKARTDNTERDVDYSRLVAGPPKHEDFVTPPMLPIRVKNRFGKVVS